MFWKKKEDWRETYRREWSEKPDWIIVRLAHSGFYAVKRKTKLRTFGSAFTPPMTHFSYSTKHLADTMPDAEKWLKDELIGDKIVWPEPPQ